MTSPLTALSPLSLSLWCNLCLLVLLAAAPMHSKCTATEHDSGQARLLRSLEREEEGRKEELSPEAPSVPATTSLGVWTVYTTINNDLSKRLHRDWEDGSVGKGPALKAQGRASESSPAMLKARHGSRSLYPQRGGGWGWVRGRRIPEAAQPVRFSERLCSRNN